MPTYISRLSHKTFFWLFIWREELILWNFLLWTNSKGWTILVEENVRALVSRALYWAANFSIHTNSRTLAAGATKKLFFLNPSLFYLFYFNKNLASWSDFFFHCLNQNFSVMELNSKTFTDFKMFVFLNFPFMRFLSIIFLKSVFKSFILRKYQI